MDAERVLIVEDEKIIALDLQRRLERFGYVVCDTAAEGEEALEKARLHRPDIILMDIMLSGAMDGIDTAKRIKEDLNIPVIFLTAYADEHTLERAKVAEPFGYILKPFKERELYTTIDMALYKFRADKKIKEQEQLFSAILHSVNDGIMAVDTSLNILFINPMAENMTGWSDEEIRGKNLVQTVTFLNAKTMLPLFPEALPQEHQFYKFKDVILRNRYGHSYVVDGSITRIHYQGIDIQGYVVAFRDVTEIKRLSATVDYQASHDTLTGLSNRDEFSIHLKTILEDIQKNGGTHTLLQLDVDRFKIVNDTCGTMAGDELLRQIAELLESLTQRNDFVARLGGDEFGLILHDCKLEDAVQVAQRLQNAVQSKKFVWNKNIFPLSFSIGVVPLTAEDNNIQNVLAAADDACYIAKEEGGGRIRVFQRNEDRYIIRRGQMEWVSKINEALEQNRFRLWYQPIEPMYSSASHVAKLEILIRMEDQDGKIISPGAFIPAAERYGLISLIDRWVIKQVMESWLILKNKNHELIKRIFSINISGPSLLDESFIDYILSTCTTYSVDPRYFCLEITETAAIQNLSYASRFIENLKKHGFSFSLDDFGSGFSSFNYLKNLPVDYLKIDGSIVQNIDESLVNFTMVESINSMGHVMGLKTIAEFVRSPAIIERLRRIGVDYAQGYALAEPRPLP
ncbi:MAG: EAL domain-containing protein [Breznakiellaceae bacterium]